LGLIVIIALVDNKLNEEVAVFSSDLVKKLKDFNRRTLNPLTGRVYFYYSRAFELCGRLADIRSVLLAAHRTASLHHDDVSHITLLNLLLRNYLHYNLYDQADKLHSKSTIKEETLPSNQLARLRYYQGRISAIQLAYTRAYKCLTEALSKSPQGASAIGFRVSVHKLGCIVQLLMGEIPERALFREKGLRGRGLAPYLRLVQAVRVGDLGKFHAVIKKFEPHFRKDKTITLIQRLRHNVIKTGLKKISIAYSQITLKDICHKLNLDGEVEDAEFIVAKAIRDEVIDAQIDHQTGVVASRENTDVYATHDPLDAFTARINFCLNLHNEAVKAMRYPDEVQTKRKTDDEDDGDREERKKQELELADKLAENDDEEI